MLKHPLSSEVDGAYQQMKVTLEALRNFCGKYDYQVVCVPPNSDPGSFEMHQAINEYSKDDWFLISETLPRLEFINLMRSASALIGNSSMGILEAPHYKLPVVNVGNRQKGRLNAGNVEFVPYITADIVCSLEKACLDESYREKIQNLENPYGDSSAALKVRQAIESIDTNDQKWYVKQKLC